MIQVSHDGTSVTMTPRQRERLRASFRARGVVRLPGLLTPALLRQVQRLVASCRFRPVTKWRFDRRQMAVDSPETVAIVMLFQDPVLFDAVRDIAGVRPLRKAKGSLFRMLPEPGSTLDWHQDLVAGRALSMCVNIGRRPYRGGTLQLRRAGSERLLAQARYGRPGDAVLFPVRKGLFHRSKPVLGPAAKTIVSLWFHER